MKTILLLAAILFGIVTAQSANVTIAWDQAPTVTVTNYIVRYWKDGAATVIGVNAGPIQTYTMQNLDAGRWLCQVTAQSAQGIESDPSNLLTIDVPVAPVIRLQLQGAASLNGPWQNVTAIVHTVNGGTIEPLAFYRGQLEIQR